MSDLLLLIQSVSVLAIFLISLWGAFNFFKYWWSMTHFSPERWQIYYRILILIITQRVDNESICISDVKIQQFWHFTLIWLTLHTWILIFFKSGIAQSSIRRIFPSFEIMNTQKSHKLSKRNQNSMENQFFGSMLQKNDRFSKFLLLRCRGCQDILLWVMIKITIMY